MNPKLRPIRPEAANMNGQPVIVLRDPLGLCDQPVAVPQALGPLLALCDGSRDEGALRAALQVRAGIFLSSDRLAEILKRLDEALLLDNDSYRQARARALDAYRAAPSRPPALAGSSYPAEPEALAALLDQFLAAAPPVPAMGPVRGLVSPHIDYARGGAVYADVWGRAAASVREADVAVILGTDHQSEGALVTLTRQSYATPFGVLPTSTAIVAEAALAQGVDAALAEELHHKSEHSIELAAVWLHHIRQGKPVRLVPILCGSFERFMAPGADPADDPALTKLLEALRRALAGRRALIVAAGDLAHCGPAFGDLAAAGASAKVRGAQADGELIEAVSRGDAAAFLAQIKAEGDRRHVCGVAPIYLALRLLEPVQGAPAGYAQLPADAQGNSFVSVCGVTLA